MELDEAKKKVDDPFTSLAVTAFLFGFATCGIPIWFYDPLGKLVFGHSLIWTMIAYGIYFLAAISFLMYVTSVQVSSFEEAKRQVEAANETRDLSDGESETS